MASPSPKPVVVLGELDGFHLGHRQQIAVAARLANDEGRPLVAVILDDGRDEHLLTVAERSVAAVALGCDTAQVIAVPPVSGAGDRFTLHYEPSDWIEQSIRDTMPGYVETVDPQGRVLSSFTLPHLGRDTNPPTWSRFIAARVQAADRARNGAPPVLRREAT